MGVYSEIAADLREDVQERITEMQNAAVLAARRADERQQAEEEQAKVMVWYREKRIKISLGGLSPLEYRQKLGLSA